MSLKPKLKPSQRLADYPNDGLCVVDGSLYCNYCDCDVSWIHKSDVQKHIQTAKHVKGKSTKRPADISNVGDSSHSVTAPVPKRQRSMGEMVSVAAKKNQMIGDLITIFAIADIPLQKVDAMRPFLRKHVTNGGSIPGSSQLRETYLPKLMPEIESAVDLLVKDVSSLNIILDEMTDNTDRVVLDILFKLPIREKPVLVETCMLDSNINHRSVAQAVVAVLGKYKIPFTTNVVDALIGDGASYITKAYKDILQPLIPDLMRIWCLSHQLNLVGEKWRDHANNALMKKFLSLMNSLFSHSTSRKLRFKAVCKRFGLPPTLLPQYNVTRWNSWYECAVAISAKLEAIKTFISEECEHHASESDNLPHNLRDLKDMIDDQSVWFTVSLCVAFTTKCMHRLGTTLDCFQSRRPLSHLVKGRMDTLSTYYKNLSTSVDPSDFGIQSVLESVEGLAEDSIDLAVRLCQQICLSTAESVQHYVSRQQSWKFFEDARVFDPRMICGRVISRDIAQYKAIPWLVMDANNIILLEEWSIYVAQKSEADLRQYINIDSEAAEHFDISRYWNDRRASLPRLAAHALRALDIPVSSADAERAFSSYNKLVCFSRQSLSDESVRALHSAAWNGDITGRFKGFE